MTTEEHEAAAPAATEALRAALEHMESHVLSGYDWLGTGSSQESADDDEREAWKHWSVIRAALASPEPTPSAFVPEGWPLRSFSPEPTPDSGLDVERLAEAIRNAYIAPSASRDMDAENIVREYARLSPADSPEEES